MHSSSFFIFSKDFLQPIGCFSLFLLDQRLSDTLRLFFQGIFFKRKNPERKKIVLRSTRLFDLFVIALFSLPKE